MRAFFLLALVFCFSCHSDTIKPLKIHFEEINLIIDQVGVSSSKPFFSSPIQVECMFLMNLEEQLSGLVKTK